jgi:hypothetical protein
MAITNVAENYGRIVSKEWKNVKNIHASGHSMGI